MTGVQTCALPIEVNNENVPVVTYHIYQGRSLPRKLVMPFKEFSDNFGHLFGLNNNDDIPRNNV